MSFNAVAAWRASVRLNTGMRVMLCSTLQTSLLHPCHLIQKARCVAVQGHVAQQTRQIVIAWKPQAADLTDVLSWWPSWGLSPPTRMPRRRRLPSLAQDAASGAASPGREPAAVPGALFAAAAVLCVLPSA